MKLGMGQKFYFLARILFITMLVMTLSCERKNEVKYILSKSEVTQDTLSYSSYYPDGVLKEYIVPVFDLDGTRYEAKFLNNGLYNKRVFRSPSKVEIWEYKYHNGAFTVYIDEEADHVGLYRLGNPKETSYHIKGDTVLYHEYIDPENSTYKQYTITNFRDTVEITSGTLRGGILWNYSIHDLDQDIIYHFEYFRNGDAWKSRTFQIQNNDTLNVDTNNVIIGYY